MPRTVASSISLRLKSTKSVRGKEKQSQVDSQRIENETAKAEVNKSLEGSDCSLNVAFDYGSSNDESEKCSTLDENEEDSLRGENDVLNVAFIDDSPSDSSTPTEILSPLSTVRCLRRTRRHAPLAYVREDAGADIPELHYTPAHMPSIFEEAERRPRPKRQLTRHMRRACFRYKPDLSSIREVAETSASALDLSSLVRSFYTGFERERYEMRVSIGLHSRRFW